MIIRLIDDRSIQEMISDAKKMRGPNGFRPFDFFLLVRKIKEKRKENNLK